MVKSCPSCGVENADTAKFCKKCGAAMPDDSDLDKKDISSSNAALKDNYSSSETNKNKSSNNALIIAIVAIVCVVIVGALILSGDGNQVATVGGIDFNIPEGFTENEDYLYSEYDEESDMYFSGTVFEDDSNQNGILVYVIEPADYSVIEEGFAYLEDNSEARRKTINGYSGYIINANSLASYIPLLDNGDDLYGFFYEENDKIVFVASNDTSYLDDVII